MSKPDFSSLELSIICAFYFDQKKADPLYDVLHHYSTYSPALLGRIQFVLIDDCSSVPVSIPESVRVNYQLFKVNENIAWNNGGARNLGVAFARTAKIILTDIEQVFPEKLLEKILAHRERRGVFYKFKRLDSKGNALTTPRNIMYMTKSVFYDALGYDEEFSGNYGFEDSFFIDLLKRKGNRFRYFSRFNKIVERSVDRHESYHNFSRDTTVNRSIQERKELLLKGKTPMSSHSRKVLDFSWIKVDEKMNVMQ